MVIIGVDSGGSHTRALALDASGAIIGVGHAGGGNPNHDSAYRENVRSAILQAAGTRLPDVVRVVAGIAGVNAEKDQVWASDSTNVPGMRAHRVQVNDAEVAHYGALHGRPGIVSIQGTGSIVFAILPDGHRVRNYDFEHYAYAAAPWIGQRAAWLLLIEEIDEADASLLNDVLRHWEVEDLDAFRRLGSEDWRCDRETRCRRFGRLAPRITAAAEAGSPLARRICLDCAAQVVEGVRLLGRFFPNGEVCVALVGSSVGSPTIRQTVEAALAMAPERAYRVVSPRFSPVVGAALLALEQEGIRLSDEALATLARLQWSDVDR